MNPLILVGLGALALLAFSGKKPTKNGKEDETKTIPDEGDNPPPDAPPEDAYNEQEFVNVAVQGALAPNWIPAYSLGQEGIDQNVLGIDEDGFVHATPGEWLHGWLTRVAYWGAYQMKGWPLELPVTCVLEMTCPEDMMPVRHALLRIKAMVLQKMEEVGLQDRRL
jgi:hypothetical protein